MDKKIKVAQIIGEVSEGGVETMIANLYRNIDHTKVEFHFFVRNTSVVINKEEIESYGGKVIIVPSIKHYFKYKKCLKNAFKENDYDVAHANMNALSFIPLKVAKKCNIPVRIAHSHSTSNKKELLRHIIKNLLRPFSRKNATHFFACSEKAGRWLFGNKKYDSGEVHLIRNAVDLKKFGFNEQIRQSVRDSLHISPTTKVVGHIGRFVKQKNHGYLIQIFEQLQAINKNTALVMVGSGDDMDKIKKTAETKGLNSVIFTGPVSNPYDYYQAMDCFCLPSLYEGLPVVGVEAQANGLKCFFSTEITKEAKLIEQTEYLSIKEKPDVWANRINEYFNNMKTPRVGAEKLYEYDIANIASNMLSLYYSFITNSISLNT